MLYVSPSVGLRVQYGCLFEKIENPPVERAAHHYDLRGFDKSSGSNSSRLSAKTDLIAIADATDAVGDADHGAPR